MKFGGFLKQTLIDYPGNISAVIFLNGCNFRCGFCHNSSLLCQETENSVEWEFIHSYLEKRKGFLDAVVVSGGEPTLYPQLGELLKIIKGMGYKVKLDTNGTNPEAVAQFLKAGWVDYIAMDVKTILDFSSYSKITGGRIKQIHFDSVKETIQLLKNSSIPYEFRTTLLRKFHTPEIINQLACLQPPFFTLQTFHGGNILDPLYNSYSSYTEAELKAFCQELSGKYQNTIFKYRI